MTTSYFDVPGIRPNLEPGTDPQRIIHVPPGTIPPAGSQLWRFMDFPKLVSLLDRNALFFTRAHKLEDHFEGTWSKATLQLLEGTTLREIVEGDGYIALYGDTSKYGLILIRPYSPIENPTERELFDRIISQEPSSEIRYSSYRGYENSIVVHHMPTGNSFMMFDGGKTVEEKAGAIGYKLHGRDATINATREVVSTWKTLVRYMMVNCWHESEYDSEAMWRVYAGDKYGIAIKTNVKSLAGCFVKRYPDGIARVEYIPYDEEIIPLGLAAPLWFKRRNFDHEREVRVIVTDLFEHLTIDANGNSAQDVCLTDVGDEGRYYDVDPKELIHEIVISPYAAPWLFELTRSVAEKYGLSVPVVQSNLNQKPS